MQEKTSISKQDAFIFPMCSAGGNIDFGYSLIIFYAGRAGWLAVGSGIIFMIPFAFWILYLGNKYPGNTILEILKITSGKYVYYLTAAAYILIIAATTIMLLTMFTQIIKIFFLEFTPAWIVMAFMVLMCFAITGNGIKKMAKLLTLLCVIAVLDTFISFPIYFKYFRIEYITPIFDTHFSGFLQGFLIAAGFSAEALLFIMNILCCMPKPDKYYSSIAAGFLVWMVILGTIVFMKIGASSSEILARSSLAGLTAVRAIQIKDFIRGLEILTIPTYQCVTAIKISCNLYNIQISVMNFFKKKPAFFSLALASLLVYIPSVLLNSFNRVFIPYLIWLAYITFAFAIFILILTSIGIMVKKKHA